MTGFRVIAMPDRQLTNRRLVGAVLAFALSLWMAQAYAFRPITSDVDLIGAYPEYPVIDFAVGEAGEARKRGEYLAKLGDCIACHTNANAGGEAFAGGLPIPTPFGTFYTPNITPDEETGIGRWTEADFVRVMQEGIRPDGSNAFPAFPYVFFNRVRMEDLKALWAYLRAIPTVRKENQGNTLPFPANVRFFQYGWKMLFFYPDAGVFEDDPNQTPAWNRGAYLVQGLGHCSMCHTPLNPLGAPEQKYYLTGGFIDGYWAPDITSRGLATASRYQVADVFVEGELINRAGPVRGPMADANHDSLRYLTEADRLAIADYLKSVVSRQPRTLPAERAGQPVLRRGAQVYANVCKICHLEGAVGAPRIGDGANWEARVDARGLRELYRHAIDGYNKMPAKGACVTCVDDDIRAGVDYLLYHSLESSQWRELNNPSPTSSAHRASGESVYRSVCSVCHDDGKLGAPSLSDTERWQTLTGRDFDSLVENTLRGLNNMPPRGGCSDCSGSEVISAVKYMLQQSQTDKDYSLW